MSVYLDPSEPPNQTIFPLTVTMSPDRLGPGRAGAEVQIFSVVVTDQHPSVAPLVVEPPHERIRPLFMTVVEWYATPTGRSVIEPTNFSKGF